MKNELNKILASQPKYRLKQIIQAWFDVDKNSYEEITTLPLELREELKSFPWLTVKLHSIYKSKIDDTEKALLELADGNLIETVLMGRQNLKEDSEAGDRYTICISSQVGCAMNCSFCATGKTGFKRNLTAEEIIDQYRFWQRYVSPSYQEGVAFAMSSGRMGGVAEARQISNIVVMGQGEPLLNYDNLKQALNIILQNTEIGPTKITVSTCGIPKFMDKILEDKEFPQVRLAISLHSAIEETRKKIMPSHTSGFLEYLVEWAKKYSEVITSRSHFIGLEYLMLENFNDDEKHLKALKKLASNFSRVRINLIPYNDISTGKLKTTAREKIEHWHEELMKSSFVCTIRHSQGQDIAAACGQLCNKVLEK
ncbi:MAG: putative dual-specificity RNA methyltransferase RlmN [Candidatus Magasanikbacteria bacterium GW2011_GWC2_37_14]|uniref:Putative dual-specificity RNA methyltransferase RlmN n=1 Tax=Candidatus Magasanikbacteria bacterium GW2011_GWC2_37_14 TaxID=1619046 RepID=A0A0G0JIY0_9BACT|nr:MAG: putative dual-specificity RNA methyltransferase RlmN [Candidatus Magasanikbacteria bacterium GW2011_GWC2_37_14]